MKHLVFVMTAALPLAMGNAQDPPIAYQSFHHGRATYHVVRADTASGAVSPGAIQSSGMRSASSMIQANRPIAAITGTFFSPGHSRPVAEVVVDGQLQSRGQRGSAVAVDWNGQVHISNTGFQEDFNWLDYRFGMRGTVRVITNGVVNPNPRAQNFRDPRIWGRAARTAIGTTKAGKLLLVATKSKVTLSELGRAMKAMGATQAVSLDGGGSTMLYYKGKMVVPTSRKLTTLFVIYDKTPFDSFNTEETARRASVMTGARQGTGYARVVGVTPTPDEQAKAKAAGNASKRKP